MTGDEKSRSMGLIKRIQGNGGTREDIDELKQVTGNFGFWYVFDELEWEGLLPEKY